MKKEFRTEIAIYPDFEEGFWACSCAGTISAPFVSPGQALEWAARTLRSEWLPFIEEELKEEV